MASTMQFGPRRAVHVEIGAGKGPLSPAQAAAYDRFDLIYRTLCAVLFNYVPTSGHPGGSISSGRFVAGLLFGALDYDFADPERDDNDLVSYAAGHKAMGLYSMWALRNEVARLAAPELLPADVRRQLRLEDLLGFRRNPATTLPLFTQHKAKALDGHPTPTMPFLRVATGASGVGVASSVGLAFGARDHFGADAPRVHLVEGEGGMTPGRVVEAMAAASAGGLDNCLLHIDWNQASIDSNKVCRDGATPGDYVQWDPRELAWLHDWNVIEVADGFDLQQVHAAQAAALAMANGQPTAVVYRTVKGWRYGIEGRASHGAGHKFCSAEFYTAIEPLFAGSGLTPPRCTGVDSPEAREAVYWETLAAIRTLMNRETAMLAVLGEALRAAQKRLNARARKPRAGAGDIAALHAAAKSAPVEIPAEIAPQIGGSSTLRGELGKVLGWYNQKSGGTVMAAAADLLGSTSIDATGTGFPKGFWHATANPDSRILSLGGICEDGISGILAGLSCFGHHMGVGSSYGAFMAPLGHIAARLHCIGSQAKREMIPDFAFRPMVLISAHAGLKTGEDGPTHADPQALQLLQENFAPGTAITLTPWDPQELWHLFTAALVARPAFIAPFVTRPNEPVLDRESLGLAPARAARQGVYKLRAAKGAGDGTLVLQGSEVANAFVQEALPKLIAEGIDLDVYYIASVELFDLLPAAEREQIFPAAKAEEAMGITGFTLPTLYRWVTSARGRAASLSPFMKGHYLGSGQADMVMLQAGLDGASQVAALRAFVRDRVTH
jgi:transketolase